MYKGYTDAKERAWQLNHGGSDASTASSGLWTIKNELAVLRQFIPNGQPSCRVTFAPAAGTTYTETYGYTDYTGKIIAMPTADMAGKSLTYQSGSQTLAYAVVADGRLTSWTAEEDKATALVSDAAGLFKVAGLDDGTYYLLETKAPDGYNKLSEPVTLTIAATTANGQNWNDFEAAKALTGITIKVGTAEAVSGDAAKGTVAATVENASGSTLPSTGGVGTKIFTYGGILLMLAAAVALVTRRKISREGK